MIHHRTLRIKRARELYLDVRVVNILTLTAFDVEFGIQVSSALHSASLERARKPYILLYGLTERRQGPARIELGAHAATRRCR